MGLIQNLFNTGMKEIEAQAEVLEAETIILMTDLDKAQKDIDKEVEHLQLINEGLGLLHNNIRWIELELVYSKGLLSYTDTASLYSSYDKNHDDLRIFESLHRENAPIAINGVRRVAGGFQRVLDDYGTEIDKLGALIETHASDSNLEQLQEVQSKFHTIYSAQVAKFNGYVEEVGFNEIEVR